MTFLVNKGSFAKNTDGNVSAGMVVAANSVTARPLRKWAEDIVALNEGFWYNTKTPVVDWDGKKILWLGTSIPHQGVGTDSYPELAAAAVGATVDNNAWSGSHARYDIDGASDDISTVKALSMTDDDVTRGLALYGSSSVYHDDFDAITKASEMTCEARIDEPFADTPFDVVVLDHNHNDRSASYVGSWDTLEVTITDIEKDTTTTITMPGHGLSVGDAIGLQISGIDYLNYAAHTVESVDGDDVTINVDSSGYSGTFSSGVAYIYDRATTIGAFDFLISRIKNAAIRNGKPDCKIILCSAPNKYTAGNTTTDEVNANTAVLWAIAQSWGVSFFDVSHYLGATYTNNAALFPDGYHPTTTAARRAIANIWASWKLGGAPRVYHPSEFLAAGATSFTHQREAIYSRFSGGWDTPGAIVSAASSLLSEDFSGGLTGWSTSGTTPTVAEASWGTDDAMTASSTTSATTSIAYRSISFDAGVDVSFDIWLDAVSGLTSGVPKTIQVAAIGASSAPNGTQHYGLQLIVTSTGVWPRLGVFLTPGDDVSYLSTTNGNLSAQTQHTLRIEAFRADTGYSGGAILYLDGAVIARSNELADSTHSNGGYFSCGVLYSNLGADIDIEIGNIELSKMTVADYADRFTGTFETPDSSTVTVVNGMIISVE